MSLTVNRRLIAIGLTCLFGWSTSYLATNVYKDYALALFVWLPTVMGASSTMLYAYHHQTTKRSCRVISMYTLIVFCLGLLAFAFEGVICIAMALPIGLLFAWIGHVVGYEIIKRKMMGSPPTAMAILMLSVPALMSFEAGYQENTDPIKPISTAIDIQASPQKVWKNIISFPQLDEPVEWLFRMGIAYPINATIQGTGVGAVRYCNFSTGSFTEPITVWNEPRLLKFNVSDQPESMKEVSPYDLHPNHLHGFFVSREGQFKLIPLPNGHTRLEGTTWYYNRIKPDIYWSLWSDYIVHLIHQRVLNHIKAQSESKQ